MAPPAAALKRLRPGETASPASWMPTYRSCSSDMLALPGRSPGAATRRSAIA